MVDGECWRRRTKPTDSDKRDGKEAAHIAVQEKNSAFLFCLTRTAKSKMVISKLAWATCLLVLVMGAQAFVVDNKHSGRSTFAAQLQSRRDLADAKANSIFSVDSAPRREAFQTVAAAVSAGLFSTLVAPTQPALASGGATAGKYT